MCKCAVHISSVAGKMLKSVFSIIVVPWDAIVAKKSEQTVPICLESFRESLCCFSLKPTTDHLFVKRVDAFLMLIEMPLPESICLNCVNDAP